MIEVCVAGASQFTFLTWTGNVTFTAKEYEPYKKGHGRGGKNEGGGARRGQGT